MKLIIQVLAEARLALNDDALSELPLGTIVVSRDGQRWKRGRAWWTSSKFGNEVRVGHLDQLIGPITCALAKPPETVHATFTRKCPVPGKPESCGAPVVPGSAR